MTTDTEDAYTQAVKLPAHSGSILIQLDTAPIHAVKTSLFSTKFLRCTLWSN